MKYLFKGCESAEVVSLLISETKITSLGIINAIHDHLVGGSSISSAASLNLVEQSNVSSAIVTLNRKASVFEKYRQIKREGQKISANVFLTPNIILSMKRTLSLLSTKHNEKIACDYASMTIVSQDERIFFISSFEKILGFKKPEHIYVDEYFDEFDMDVKEKLLARCRLWDLNQSDFIYMS